MRQTRPHQTLLSVSLHTNRKRRAKRPTGAELRDARSGLSVSADTSGLGARGAVQMGPGPGAVKPTHCLLRACFVPGVCRGPKPRRQCVSSEGRSSKQQEKVQRRGCFQFQNRAQVRLCCFLPFGPATLRHKYPSVPFLHEVSPGNITLSLMYFGDISLKENYNFKI